MSPYREMKLMAEASESNRLQTQAKLDRVTAERGALQRELEQQKRYVEINADSAHGKHMEGLRYRDERDALQQRLTAADERADAAIVFVTRLIECAGGQPSIATGYLRDILDSLRPVDGGDEHDATKDLACYFGLTYASWLTLPRVLMEAMPEEWKRSMATLLNQYDAYPNQPSYGTTVRVTVDGKMVRTPEWLVNYRHPDRSMINRVRGLPG